MALSDTEASIVAPFCSANKSIADIPKVIAEGRCALETSFTAFKYMAVYPVVQLIISACAYYHRSQLGNAAYIIDDLGIVLGLATFMTYTAPAKKLSLERPAHSLFSSSVLSSLLGQVFIGIFFFVFNLRMLRSQSWFCPSEIAQSGINPITFTPIDILAPLKKTFPCYYIDPERDVFQEALVSTYETTFAWTFGHFQLIIAALAFSLCSTFRLPLWTNKLLVLWLVFSFAFSSFLLLYGPSMGDYEFMRQWFQFRDDGQIPQEYRTMTFMLVLMNLLVSLLWESVVVNYFFKNMGKSGACCWSTFNDKESVHGDFETIPEAAEIGPQVLINPHPKGKS
jgi:magnesium-transporting ATPase (P-type)